MIRRYLYSLKLLATSLMLIITQGSCSPHVDKVEEPKLIGDESEGLVRLEEPSLRPVGPEPLEFPPDRFPWQPEDTPVIVHTALESYYKYLVRDDVSIDRIKSKPGLYLKVSLLIENKVLPHNPQTRTWVALDLSEMRFDGRLHFFELRPNKRDPLVGSRTAFLWQPQRNVVFYVASFANQIDIFITKDSSVSASEEFPQVEEPWLSLAKRCYQKRCPVKMYVWSPEEDRFATIDLSMGYRVPQETPGLVPMLTAIESSRLSSNSAGRVPSPSSSPP